MAITVVVRGQQGPAGPSSIAVGSVISSRGRLAVGNTVGTPVALAPGAAGTYLRSNGTDPLYSALLAADMPTGIDAAKLADGTISNTELQNLNGLAGNIVTLLAAKADTAHSHTDRAQRGIYTDHEATSSAVPVDNTTSTVTYANAMDHTLVLPTGTWTVRALGGLNLIHSASGTALMRVSVNGQDSTARSMTNLSTTIYQTCVDDDSLGGMSGTIHVYVQFRASTAGTVTVKNPFLWIHAERTA